MMTPQGTKPAFILLGGFGVVCRNPLYLTELRKRGYRILLATPESWRDDVAKVHQEPGHPAADIDEVAFVKGTLGLDGSFTSGVVGQALKWSERYDIVGVYAVGEIMVEPTGIVADALNLRSPGLRATRVCRSKYLQRWYLKAWSPRSTVIAPEARSDYTTQDADFPCVVKPSGRHSSSGVETAEDAEALANVLGSYPSYETVLVEQKIDGQEFSVESLIQDGEIVFASVTRKETTSSHAQTFVELSHSVPTAPHPAERDMLKANAEVLQKLGFADGIAHSEWRVDATGRPFLMEIAARTPGDGLLVLYELSTGQPLEPQITRIALGEPATYPRPSRFARQVYLEHRPGRLNDVSVSWPGVEPVWVGASGLWPKVGSGPVGDGPTLRAVFVLANKGAAVGPLRSSDDRVVTFFIDAATVAELDALEEAVRSSITLDIDAQ